MNKNTFDSFITMRDFRAEIPGAEPHQLDYLISSRGIEPAALFQPAVHRVVDAGWWIEFPRLSSSPGHGRGQGTEAPSALWLDSMPAGRARRFD